MAIVISIANQKGGVAKTTSCLNIGAALGQAGYKTLLVDFDPQSSLTKILNRENQTIRYVGDWLQNRCVFTDVVQRSPHENLDYLPSHIHLRGDEMDMQKDFINGNEFLSIKLQEVGAEYDFVLIDTLPSLSLLCINALFASQFVLIPSKMDYVSIGGLSQLTRLIADVKKKKPIEILGVFSTIYRTGVKRQERCYNELKAIFPSHVLRAKIRINAAIEEAAYEGLPVTYLDSQCRGAQDYHELTKEILQRCPLKKKAVPVA